MNNLNILDCTCRDGGYYNNWYFNKTKINKYLQLCSKIEISYVEIGFLFDKAKHPNLGPFAYSEKKNIDNLNIPKNIKIAVMINAKDFYSLTAKEIKFQLTKSLSPLKKHVVMVRVAIDFDEFLKAQSILKIIANLNYEIALNLMQSHGKSKKRISETIRIIKLWKVVKYLYFADSLGCMSNRYVKFLYKTAKKYWNNNLGFHGHDNKKLALSNSIIAYKYGANFLDCTILGMGRGAGNTSTEKLLKKFKNINRNILKKEFIQILQYFKKLKIKYQWGYNQYYNYAANKKIHPTYVQKLLTSLKYKKKLLTKILKNLTNFKSDIYSSEYVNNVIYDKKKIDKCKNLKKEFDGKDILILGAGNTGCKYKNKIKKFINNNNALIISLNINKFIEPKYIDYFIFCYDFRVFFEIQEAIKFKKKIIMPLNNFSDYIPKIKKNRQIINYGLVKKKNMLKSRNSYCILDYPRAISYCLMILCQSNIKSLNLAFIDGYKNNKFENDIINNAINYFKSHNEKKINFLTKTNLINEK
jgi:4-hydroxy 2-oxovalerate aldolase